MPKDDLNILIKNVVRKSEGIARFRKVFEGSVKFVAKSKETEGGRDLVDLLKSFPKVREPEGEI